MNSFDEFATSRFAGRVIALCWEFSGDFRILNSGRADVACEDWHGQKLNRKLLDLLQKY